MDFLPLILIIIVVYLFWIRPKIKTNKLKELQNNLLKYGIKGMSYRNFNHKLHSGSFFGYICNEPENSQDKNAIAIYNNNGLHLGYIPAWTTEELKSLLGEQLNISVKIFGTVSYDRNTKNWSGIVFVPNGIDINQQTKLYQQFIQNPTSFDYIEWA